MLIGGDWLKLYTYEYWNKYRITDQDPQVVNSIDIYFFSRGNNNHITALGIDRSEWNKLVIFHNGHNKFYSFGNDATFNTRKDAEEFLRELEPYIILSEITGEGYE